MAEARSGVSVKVAVVGAGVVGLSTATLLQEALPGVSVTVLADKFGRETTSHGAAGMFYPGPQLRGDTEEDPRRWLADSFAHYRAILHSENSAEAGVKQLAGFHFSNKSAKSVWNPLLEPLLEDYRLCTEEELRLHGYRYGTSLTTMLIECRRYLPYLENKFVGGGGRMERRRLDTLEELVGRYDMVCNCSGLGAKDLCPDALMTPIRGQVLKVRAPWVQHFYYGEDDACIFPGIEVVTLGGTRQFDNHNGEVNKHDTDAIWEGCVELLPSIKDAEVLEQWVGWRPYRPSIRVQKELLTFPGGKTLKVIHNYGHGAYGVMTSPGTAMHAVRLVQEVLAAHRARL